MPTDRHLDILIELKTMSAAQGAKLDAIDDKLDTHIDMDERVHDAQRDHTGALYKRVEELDKFKNRVKGIGAGVTLAWGGLLGYLGIDKFGG